jgi:hypothetical protein
LGQSAIRPREIREGDGSDAGRAEQSPSRDRVLKRTGLSHLLLLKGPTSPPDNPSLSIIFLSIDGDSARDRHREIGRIWNPIIERNQINPFLVELPHRQHHFDGNDRKLRRASIAPPSFAGVER